VFFIDTFVGTASVLTSFSVWGFILLGALWGVFVGAMPGVGSSVGFALLLPLTFIISPVNSVAMLLAVSVGNAYGNSLPAIVLGIPGSPATIMTVMDGNALYKQGKGDIALGGAYIGALAGQMVSIPLFVLLVVPLADLAYVFQPPELFGIYVFGMVAVVSIASANVVKGLISACLGLLVGLVGTDPLTSLPRFTFGITNLLGGLEETIVVIGILALGEIFRSLRQSFDWSMGAAGPSRVRLPRLRAMGGREIVPPLLGGTVIGTLVGAVPGAGSTTAALVSYQQARMWSKNPEQFGKGSMSGIIANEAAQNAANSGELIPTLALGIPAGGSMLILLGALIMQGFVPGPFLIVQAPELLYAAVAGLTGATIILAVIGMRMAGWTLAVSKVDRQLVLVGALALVVLGAYAYRGSASDVLVMLFFGVIGYWMYRFGYSPAAAALAVVLSRGFESSLRYGLALSDDSFWRLVTRPVTATILLVSLAVLAIGLIREVRTRRRPAAIEMQRAIAAEVEGIDLPPRPPHTEPPSEQRS
jgi:putative tricarboxylic transport membrane protein